MVQIGDHSQLISMHIKMCKPFTVVLLVNPMKNDHIDLQVGAFKIDRSQEISFET